MSCETNSVAWTGLLWLGGKPWSIYPCVAVYIPTRFAMQKQLAHINSNFTTTSFKRRTHKLLNAI